MSKWILVVLILLLVGCNPVMATKPPKLEIPIASKQATTPQFLPTGTIVPQTQNKKLKTPVLKATNKYKRGLNHIEELVEIALAEDKSLDHKWKRELYQKIKDLRAIAPDPLYDKTSRLLADMTLGVEFADPTPIRKALKNIQEIKSMIQ